MSTTSEMPTRAEFFDIYREFFPGSTDQEAHDTLINYTGYPLWFDGDAREMLRKQLTELKTIGHDGVLLKQQRQEAAITAVRKLWKHLEDQKLGLAIKWLNDTTSFLSLTQVPGQSDDDFKALAQELGLEFFGG